jgi:hypothetical protein
MLKQRSAPTKKYNSRSKNKGTVSGPSIRRRVSAARSFKRSRSRSKLRTNSFTRMIKNVMNAKERDRSELKQLTMNYIDFITSFSGELERIFHHYEPESYKDESGKTMHLLKVGLPYHNVVNMGHKKEYNVQLTDKYQALISLFNKSFSITILPLIDGDIIHGYKEQGNTNNTSISYQDRRKMYIYGVKASSPLTPRISGTVLNRSMFDICKAMKIGQVFIADSAGVNCAWDESISVDHFSILRVIGGKATFYESLPGHFLNPEKAQEEKDILERETPFEEKVFIKKYLQLKKEKNTEGCHRINAIIDSAIEKLNNHAGNPKDFVPHLFEYVMTPLPIP